MIKAANNRFKVSAICGSLAPIVAFTCILLSIISSSNFNWFNNALSDLGVEKGVTSVLFNLGLIVSGVLLWIFGLGFFMSFRKNALTVAATLSYMIDVFALVMIGIFNENSKPLHYCFSLAFFILFPVSTLMVCSAFFRLKRQKMGFFTLATGAFAAIVWAVQFLVEPFQGVAIPETLSALAACAWVVVMSVDMFTQASHSNVQKY